MMSTPGRSGRCRSSFRTKLARAHDTQIINSAANRQCIQLTKKIMRCNQDDDKPAAGPCAVRLYPQKTIHHCIEKSAERHCKYNVCVVEMRGWLKVGQGESFERLHIQHIQTSTHAKIREGGGDMAILKESKCKHMQAYKFTANAIVNEHGHIYLRV